MKKCETELAAAPARRLAPGGFVEEQLAPGGFLSSHSAKKHRARARWPRLAPHQKAPGASPVAETMPTGAPARRLAPGGFVEERLAPGGFVEEQLPPGGLVRGGLRLMIDVG
jgi:hypothetical protein